MVGAGGGLCIGLSLISPLRIIRSRDFMYRTLHLKEAVASSDVIVTEKGASMRRAVGKSNRRAVGRSTAPTKRNHRCHRSVDTTVKKKVKSKLSHL